MKQSVLYILIAFIFTACLSPSGDQSAPQVTVTLTATSIPTTTPIPTPTTHPQVMAIREQIAQSADFTLNADGQIEMQTEEGMTIVPDIQVQPDGRMTFTHNGQEFTANTETLEINGQTIRFKDTDGKTWVWDGEKLVKIYTKEELFSMTNDEKMNVAPKLEAHEKWRATGEYVLYTNQSGEVMKAFDLTIGEYRDIPDYPVTKPENFRNSEISVEELFNGDYFLWLQKQAKTLSCDSDMRTDIPMAIFRGAITPNPDTAPNFTNGGEFFIRDHTTAFTRFILEDGTEIHYAVMPIFMCNLNDKTDLFPIITVFSSFNPNTNRTQSEDNALYMADVMPRWLNDMKTTPIAPSATMTYAVREGIVDPLVSKTFESPQINWELRIQRFMAGDWSALSEPNMVFLNDITTSRAHKFE